MNERIKLLREDLQDIVDVANISDGSGWYAEVARKALEEDEAKDE